VNPPVRALDLDTVTRRLAGPRALDLGAAHDGGWAAATALVLAPADDGLNLAFIERARRPGDRWSGQMALPGGRRDPGDPDLATTAVRETAEEIGLELTAPIGRLADRHGRGRSGPVATFVFAVDAPHPLVPQPTEVAAADWIALPHLVDPGNATRTRWVGIPFPGIAHRDRVIWGLTLSILDDFADRVGLTLPRR
jgi:8-oxo-dGTP pyrophosphatase MutT (NUDIX family)